MSVLETIRRLGRSDRAADADAEAGDTPTRPAIGLVLGGGAARGFAHIGVLRTLVSRGIVPDVIVGTSIGAVVGGCHAAGHLDAFEAWGRGLTKRGVLGYLDISLTGSGGVASTSLANLFTAGTWSVAASALQPVFNAGRNRSRVELAEASPDTGR